MKIFLLSSLILLSTLLLFSCKKENNPIPPPEEQPQVNLTLEDVSCTEAWIKLSTSSLALPSNIDLYRDSSLVKTINLTSEDTVLYVDSLLPNHTYKYQPVIQSTGQSGNLLSVTTMDTTSHNFSFQTWTFGGQAGTCTLYDVAIIDENNIWAVGEIYLLDTLGQPDPDRYNLAVWNGNNWEIKRVPYYYQGQPFYHPIRSVFAFGANDIWFCGNGLIHWDGNQYNPVAVPNWGPYWMNEIWGTSDNDLYVVGDNGHIAHYQNGIWSSIESGTEGNLSDIWGTPNPNGGFNKYIAADNYMLKIDNNGIPTEINGLSGQIIISIWGKSERLMYTAGNGVVLYKNNKWEKIDNPEVNSIYRLKGERLNEIYGISSPGNTIKYFNGYNWHTLNTEADNRYWSIDSKDNEVVVAGYRGEAAIVTIVTKN